MLVLNKDERELVVGVLRELDPTGGRPPELRKAKRQGVVQWTWARHLPNWVGGKAAVFKVLLRDVSTGGLGLWSRRCMRQGEWFVVTLRFKEGGGRLALCRVMHSHSVRDGWWTVGAGFVAGVDDPDGTAAIPRSWFERVAHEHEEQSKAPHAARPEDN